MLKEPQTNSIRLVQVTSITKNLSLMAKLGLLDNKTMFLLEKFSKLSP
jgi:hypothetical protein